MSGIGVVVQPLQGWRQWIEALSVCPQSIIVDTRGVAPDDVEIPKSGAFTFLVWQSQGEAWLAHLAGQAHRLAVAVENPATFPSAATPCVRSVEHLQNLPDSAKECPELLLLPSDVAGSSGDTGAFVLFQAARQRFPAARLQLITTAGPEVAATLLRQGADTVLLSDQLTLLSDFPLTSARQRQIARLQRGLIRRYSVQTPFGSQHLQVAPLDPRDWGAREPMELERYAEAACPLVIQGSDHRLVPMSEGVLLGRQWSDAGLSCSEVIGLYQRATTRPVTLQSTAPGQQTMAQWLGTRLPVVQGPMTRVSDGAAFARAVADAGAMPMIAAAMLPADRLGRILQETSALCADVAWGVGLLAFRPQADLQPQIEKVLEVRPDLIVLAGGHSAQIAQFGDLADRVVLHSPTPELFERQLSEGCRRFILEGRECGGHTGPCSSLSLWEGCLRVLAQQPKHVREETSLLFAGGIHGPASTRFIADLLRQFELSQLSHGVLVGTLALFSHEAVRTGAISSVFQKVLIDSIQTVLLETAPGHQSRCALTPFADEFLRQRRLGLEQGLTGAALSSRLDSLILGRLRLASKGLRRQGDQLQQVSEEIQLEQGMFMVGEVAALQHRPEPLRDLLDRLYGNEAGLQDESRLVSGGTVQEPIAITWMAVALPGASSLTAYWSLIIRQQCQIKVVPEERWPSDRYYSENGSATSVVSHWGTFIDPVVIDLAPYPLTPAQVAVTEPTQILALDLVSQLFNDPGACCLTAAERERTAVVFAASGGAGELGQAYTIQTALASDPERFSSWLDQLPSWTNSSFPGLLSNVTAGRISNAFDFSGSNLLVDAACASALAALDVAIAKLRARECDRVIVGSVDNLQGPFPYFCFSQSGALSRQGQSRPFCVDSDGIVIGEGCAVIALERLESASRSGAEIHAVIDAIGSSSDGKGRSLTAPSHRGQMLAFDRAFAGSDRHPTELRYYEAHGTGTPVGDRSEITALTGFLQSCGVDRQRCAIGSVKALIGHTKASAGLAGLIKAALAIRHGTLPGQGSVREPHPELAGDGPVYVPSAPSPWPSIPGERLAAVSAFGFGGTNFTVLLSDRHRRVGEGAMATLPSSVLTSAFTVIALPLSARNAKASLLELRGKLVRWLQGLAGDPRPINAKILECPLLPRYSSTWDCTAFLALNRSGQDGLALLDAVDQRLNGDSTQALVHLSRSLPSSPASPPPVVMLFPGQGSVYPGMGADLMLTSPRVRQALDLLQTIHPDPDQLIRVLGGSRSAADRRSFWAPSMMQTVLMLHQLAALDWLLQLGLRPDAFLGHSIGDYLVLYASGALSLEGLIQLVVGRALCLEQCIAAMPEESAGGMLVVKAPLQECENQLLGQPSLTLANRNAPNQGVVAGPSGDLDRWQVQLTEAGLESVRLDLSVAYHHPSLQPAATAFAELIAEVPIASPAEGQAVWLSTAPERGLTSPEEIRRAISHHLCSQVDFVASVERMERAKPGAIYIDVGPRQTGSRLLHANGVDAERTLRMDDRDDPASQPLTVAFELLNRGLTLDESALMRLTAEPRRTLWTTGTSGRLPYLVNGHAAIPMDGRPFPPSPLVPVFGADNGESEDSAMPDQGSDRLLEVYAEYQKTMRKFLESQDQVFSAVTGTRADSSPSPLPPPEPPVPSAPVRIDQEPAALSPMPTVAPAPLMVAPESTSLSDSESAFANPAAMQAFITDVLVDRTGYPPELLELDAHLESDLGIDSIKQVEVLGALIDGMPVSPSTEQMQDIRAAAREKQTIRELSKFMLDLHGGKH